MKYVRWRQFYCRMISAEEQICFFPPRNKVSIDDNTLHMQSRVIISTDGDFSEGETVFVTPAVHFYD